MSDLRYTICTYIADLATPRVALDFAVLVAGEKEVALVGMNLSAYGIETKNPFEAEVVENTFDVMFRRLRAACDGARRASGLAVLDNLVSNNRSNFQFRQILDAPHGGSICEVAFLLFASEIQRKVSEPARHRSDSPMWYESERIMEQWLKVGAPDGAADSGLLCASSFTGQ